MSGLFTKNTLAASQFINPDGSPKPGTPGFYYMEAKLKEVQDKAYNDGVNYVVNDITERLHKIVYMDFEGFDEYAAKFPLPRKAEKLNKLIQCLSEYSKGLRTQLNNTNKTNFREGSRTLVLRTERIMGEKRGDILNPMLAKPIQILTPGPAKKVKPEEKPRTKQVKVKDITPDPTDELINKVENDN